MLPNPQTTRPRSGASRPGPYIGAPGSVRRQYTEAAVKTSDRPRRCPWYADVVRLAADPVPPYHGWRGVAILYAGSGSWDRAAETREAARRACTVLPPGADPAAIVWPAVRQWIADVADLEPGTAIELGRCLIDRGAEMIVISGERISGGMVLRRARR